MPVLPAYAIEDSTDIFRISWGGGFEHPKPPLGTPLSLDTHFKICVVGKVLLGNLQMDPHLLAKRPIG